MCEWRREGHSERVDEKTKKGDNGDRRRGRTTEIVPRTRNM